eukprot:10960373-Ditylum_brightwellii.AAC.1
MPLGSEDFTNMALDKLMNDMEEEVATIARDMADRQTGPQLFAHCHLQQIPFLMAADVLANADTDLDAYKGPFAW